MSADDESLARLETRLGRLLVAGLAAAAASLAAGLVLFFVRPGSASADSVLAVGLMILMATPILRVVVSVVEYVRMRDWFFVAITLSVLGVLAATVWFAVARR